MFSRVEFVDVRFFHPLVPRLDPEWRGVFIRANVFCGPRNCGGVLWPRCLSISPVVSRCEGPIHLGVRKASSSAVPLVSAKRDDCAWAIAYLMGRKELGHLNRLKPFRVQIAPVWEQLTNLIRLLLVDYVSHSLATSAHRS